MYRYMSTYMAPVVMERFCYFMILILLPSLLNASFYFVTERPVVTYANPKYIGYFNVTAQRLGRRNPLYYVSIHILTKEVADNNLTIDVYFYEFVQNQYRSSFLEMHFKWCNLFLKDAFFGPALRKTLPGKCPHPIGAYHLYNLTINGEAIPESFPFTKGRLLVNSSYIREPVFSGYIGLELKVHRQKRV